MAIGGQSFGHVAAETTGRSSNENRFASFFHNWILSNCSFSFKAVGLNLQPAVLRLPAFGDRHPCDLQSW
jgi:hypothetical protein